MTCKASVRIDENDLLLLLLFIYALDETLNYGYMTNLGNDEIIQWKDEYLVFINLPVFRLDSFDLASYPCFRKVVFHICQFTLFFLLPE